MSQIDSAANQASETQGEHSRSRCTVLAKLNQKIKVGSVVLVSTGHGAVEHGQADALLGAQGLPERSEQFPVILEILPLARRKAESSWPCAAATQRPLRGGPAEGALLSAEIHG